MTIRGQKTQYIRYNIGDIVREREWIYFLDEPLYGIITYVERHAFEQTQWIPYEDDRIHVFWFKRRSTEMLPATFVEPVSVIEEEI